MPHLDNRALHDLGRAGGTATFAGVGAVNNQQASQYRIQAVLGFLYCPTRRAARAFPVATAYQSPQLTTGPVTTACRTDYAINGGSVAIFSGAGPSSVSAVAGFSWPTLTTSSTMTSFNGLSATRSQVAPGAVSDGLSNTYLVAEKYLAFDNYTNGLDPGDQLYAVTGGDCEIVRWGSTTLLPVRDMPINAASGANPVTNSNQIFGSAHAAGWNAAFCDGSVRTMSYAIDAWTHQYLACRNDHNPIDPSKL